jgi:DNA-binding transcriptional regulator YiaG
MTKGPCIYVVGPIDDNLKVGYTGNLSNRLYHLRREFGKDVDCLFSAPVGRQMMSKIEARAHDILRDSWKGRELFSVPLERAMAAVLQAMEELGTVRSTRDEVRNGTTIPSSATAIPLSGMPMLRRDQVKAARAILGWTADGFAERTGLSVNTVRRFEGGGRIMADTQDKMRGALEAEGIDFPDDDTVAFGRRRAAKGEGAR